MLNLCQIITGDKSGSIIMSNIHSTNEEFRIKVIRLLDTEWEKTDPASQAAEKLGYSLQHFNRKFNESFGMTFMCCLRKIRLRRAAMKIRKQDSLENIRSSAGFANPQSFSKAFKAEFGIAPVAFLKNRYEIPDIPIEYHVCGMKVNITYEELPRTFFHEEVSVKMYSEMTDCMYGSPGITRFKNSRMVSYIPADYYAVFSVALADAANEKTDSDMQGKSYSCYIEGLMRTVYCEWAVINMKNLKNAGYVYEKYTGEYISLYVPVYKFDVRHEPNHRSRGPVAWIDYIDENITKKLTEDDIVKWFNYSMKHFQDTFYMYYDVSLAEYMKKRKLSLMAAELQGGKKEIRKVAEKYGYHSESGFIKEFYEEFRQTPEQYSGEKYSVEDLHKFYSEHKEHISIRYKRTGNIVITGDEVKCGECMEDGGMIEAICRRLKVSKDEEKAQFVIWKKPPEATEPVCLCGFEHKMSPYRHQEQVVAEGGLYAVLTDIYDNDEESLVDVYRTLYRCAYMGWIGENWSRIDLQRLTFVRYENRKLYFYIPVYD